MIQQVRARELPHQLRLSRRSVLGRLATATGACATVVAAGCGRGAKQSGSQASGPTAVAEKPRSGGQLNLAYKNDPPSFDPSTKLTDVAEALLRTHDSLLGIKTGPSVPYQDIVLQPGLAQRWEAPDALAYTFHLTPNVKFADQPPVNGRALTSADIQWTYEYLSRTGAAKGLRPAPTASMFSGLDRIETPDASTVVVHFAKPFVPFLSYAASQWAPILAHEVFDQDGDFSKHAVGTGPFALDEGASQRGSRWVYKRNPAYFVAGQPYLDQVNVLTISEDATMNAAFQTKQIDLLDYFGLQFDTVQQTKKVVPDAVTAEVLSPDGFYIYMSVSKAPLNDVRIRQAFSFGLDRDEFIKTFSQGKGSWALAGALPGLFSDAEIKQILKFDPARAQQLVREAGYPTGVDIEFIYPANTYGQQFISTLQLIQAQVKKAGINIRLKSLDHATESASRRSGDYQLGMTPRGQGVPQDLDSSLYPVFYPGSAENLGRVNDPELTPLLDAQRAEVDPAKRKEIWRQAVRRINEAPWATALYFGTRNFIWHPYLKNYAPNIAYEGERLTDAWLAK